MPFLLTPFVPVTNKVRGKRKSPPPRRWRTPSPQKQKAPDSGSLSSKARGFSLFVIVAQLIQMIGAPLHHLAALIEIFRTIVSSSNPITRYMRQLAFNHQMFKEPAS